MYWKGSGSDDPAEEYASSHLAFQVGGGLELRWPGSFQGIRLAADVPHVAGATATGTSCGSRAVRDWTAPLCAAALNQHHGRIVTFVMTGGLVGWLGSPPGPVVTGVFAMASTASSPLVTRAKIT